MRSLKALTLSILISIGLFYLMHVLISGGNSSIKSVADYAVVEFISLKRDSDVESRSRLLPKEKPIEEKPPNPQLSTPVSNELNIKVSSSPLQSALSQFRFSTGPYLGDVKELSGGDGDIVPIVRIPPRYPRNAALNGIEGWVELEFTIEKDGTVSDVKVLNAKPRRVFDQAAKQAILRWKFKPRVIAGKPVERRATQVINFNLRQ